MYERGSYYITTNGSAQKRELPTGTHFDPSPGRKRSLSTIAWCPRGLNDSNEAPVGEVQRVKLLIGSPSCGRIRAESSRR